MKLVFEKVESGKTIFGQQTFAKRAEQNGFIYFYITDFGWGKLCKGGMITPDGYRMDFNSDPRAKNKFLNDPQLIELWFQSHADGVGKEKSES